MLESEKQLITTQYEKGFANGIDGLSKQNELPTYVFGFNLGQLARSTKAIELKKTGLHSLLELMADLT